MSDPTTLLPNNATELELAASKASIRIDEIPVEIRNLKNPAACPAAFLPWLAWALSVDNWDPAWPLAVRREVIANAVAVHRKKGTLGAVRRALAGLGVSAEVVEWWQETPAGDPYTFKITALANDNLGAEALPLDAQGQQDIIDVVTSSKNLRSHFTLSLGVETKSTLGFGQKGLAFSRFVGRGTIESSFEGETRMGVASNYLGATRFKASGVGQMPSP